MRGMGMFGRIEMAAAMLMGTALSPQQQAFQRLRMRQRRQYERHTKRRLKSSSWMGFACGKRAAARYARQQADVRQFNSHPVWQAVNKHLREHLCVQQMNRHMARMKEAALANGGTVPASFA